MAAQPVPVVFIPALLCDAAMYQEVIGILGSAIDAQVMLSPKSRLEDSVADILARAPATFVLVGTSYGGNLALEVALAAPERVTALWLMGCNPAAPQAGGPDLAGGLRANPTAVFNMLAGLVVNQQATAAAATFLAMAQRVGGAAGAEQAQAVAARRQTLDRLEALRMPALLVWGEQDALVPHAAGLALASGLPNAAFHLLSDCGHLPTLEKPAQSAALFSGLLQRLTESADSAEGVS